MGIGARYDFCNTIQGDTVDEISVTIQENGTNVDLTGATISLAWESALIADMTHADMTIAGSTITIPKWNTPEAAGYYSYNFTVTFPDNTVRTYLYGKIHVKEVPN